MLIFLGEERGSVSTLVFSCFPLRYLLVVWLRFIDFTRNHIIIRSFISLFALYILASATVNLLGNFSDEHKAIISIEKLTREKEIRKRLKMKTIEK